MSLTADRPPERPRDAFSPSAFGSPGNGHWQPPLLVRTAVWLVKDVGVPVVLSGVFVAVILGWLESPLTRIVTLEKTMVEHAGATAKFQGDLVDGLRKQRCITAVSSLSGRSDVIAAAALSPDPCAYLEHVTRRGPGP